MGDAIRAERLVPLMGHFATHGPFFLDVFNLASGANLAVAAADAAAGQRLEPEQFNQTQLDPLLRTMQAACPNVKSDQMTRVACYVVRAFGWPGQKTKQLDVLTGTLETVPSPVKEEAQFGRQGYRPPTGADREAGIVPAKTS